MKKQIISAFFTGFVLALMISMMHICSVCMVQQPFSESDATGKSSLSLNISSQSISEGSVCAKSACHSFDYYNYYFLVTDNAGNPLANTRVDYQIDSGNINEKSTDFNGIVTVSVFDGESHNITIGDATTYSVNNLIGTGTDISDPIVAAVRTTTEITIEKTTTETITGKDGKVPVFLTTTADSDPDIPIDPDTPVAPDTPDNPDDPDGSSGSDSSSDSSDSSGTSGTQTTGAKTPKTGDEMNLVMPIIVVVLAAVIMIVIVWFRRKKH